MEVKMVKKLLKRKKRLAIAVMVLLLGTSSFLTAGKSSGEGYLGVTVERISSEEKEELGVTFGILITKVVKGESADKAGILANDVIQYFNSEKIRRPSDLVEEVRAVKPKSRVVVSLVRKGKKLKVTVVMGEYKPLKKNFWKGDKDLFIYSHGGAYLGVHLQKLDKDLAGYFAVKEDAGALILKVEQDTPAEEAGLKSGDVIVKMNEEKVKNPDDVVEILTDAQKGDKIGITVIRHGKKHLLKAELDERPGFKGMGFLKGLEGKKIYFDMPSYHIEIPDPDDFRVIWKDYARKVNKKMKKVKKKVRNKLKIIEKSVSI
jgi:S1-C subfamily serine protease